MGERQSGEKTWGKWGGRGNKSWHVTKRVHGLGRKTGEIDTAKGGFRERPLSESIVGEWGKKGKVVGKAGR